MKERGSLSLSVRDRIDRAKGMTARQAIRLKRYTTRSLKRGETAGYSRLVRAKGEAIRLPSCATQRGSPMNSDTYVGNPVDDFSD